MQSADTASNLQIYYGKIYNRANDGTFKQRHGTNKYHSIRKDIGQIPNFQRNAGDLKNSTHNHKYNVAFKKRYLTTKITGNCYLFLKQKLFIVQHQGSDLPNKRNELISKCRHKSKFKFVNYKSWCESIVTIFWYHSIVSLELFNKWLLRHEIISL